MLSLTPGGRLLAIASPFLVSVGIVLRERGTVLVLG